MCGYQRNPLIIMVKQKCCNKNRVARKHWSKASRTINSCLNGVALKRRLRAAADRRYAFRPLAETDVCEGFVDAVGAFVEEEG